MHIWEDNYIVEIIDPVTLKPLPDGEEGELVMTTSAAGRDADSPLPDEGPDPDHPRPLSLRPDPSADRTDQGADR